MKIKMSISLILVVLSFTLYAQEVNVEKPQKFVLPQLYLEQKQDRTVMNLASFICAGIAYTKSIGQTPEEFGTFVGNFFAPGWKEA